MKYKLRYYQKEASDKAIDFFLDDSKDYNGVIVAPTGTGKSILIADIAYRLNSDVLVLCPSKEIIEQNYAKMKSYGVECSMYSASVGKKEISKVTFCSIGSIRGHPELFKHFRFILVDECHLISNRKGTMYFEFLKQMKCKVLGLSATPFRLESFCQIDRATKKPKLETAKSWLQMITGYKKPVFKKLIHVIQIEELIKNGYLANVRYFDVKPPGWEQVTLFKNTSGSDYSDKSVRYAYDKTQFSAHLANVVRRLIDNRKTGIKRNGILVFTRFVEEAMELALRVDGCAVVSGDTPKKEREEILNRFKSGEIKVVVNSGVLVCGFDYPELDTVVIARPTMSLSLFYQIVGRCIRPHKNKEISWVIDLAGNIERFGKIEDLKFINIDNEKWEVFNKEKQLTDVYFK